MISINDTDYKLIYLDTNVISEMGKNYKNVANNILETYFTGKTDEKYALVLTAINIVEINNEIKYHFEHLIRKI